MGYTDLRVARRRNRTLIAAAAAVATALLGAAPALAADETPNGAVADTTQLRWQAIDAAQQPVHGAAFEVQRSGADAAGLLARVADNTGQAGYDGLDQDPAPGTFSLHELRDARDAARTEPLVAGDVLLVRLAATADTAAGAWQEVRAEAANAATEPAPVRAVPVAEAPAEPAEPAAPAEQPTAEPTPTEQPAPTTQPKPAKAAPAAAGASITPLAAGPDAPGVSAPYVYWRAVDQDGALLGGATFELQGPRSGGSWGTTYTIADCTSAPCTGLDRDPDPGEFQVKFLSPASNPTTNSVVTASAYRVRQTVAPAGYTLGSSAWREIPRSGNTGNWGGQTYSFGDYASTRIPPARIVVSVGGDRTAAGGVTALSGVTLLLNTGTGSPSGTRPDGVSGTGAGWARCVSDSAGECVFEVPGTESGGTNRDRRFWVVQPSTGAPTGWFANTSLGTGSNGSPSATAYVFRTGDTLRSGNTYRSTSNFMYDSAIADDNSTPTASAGVWQNSRNNPALVQSCGIDVALIMDFSGSVSGSVPALKAAAGAFTDALVGTPSRMSLFSFSDSSPANTASANYPALTSVATQTQADAFKARWNGWDADGGTNWEQALATAADARATNPYDVAIVITDGQPTFWGANASGPGDFTRLVEMEKGIFAANALKAQGTRVVAFGVGAGVSGTANAANLAAISGPTVNSDYYQTSNYQAAGTTLRALAQGACKGQLTITKMIVPNSTPAGQITGATPAPAGWNFTVSNPGAGVTLPTPATLATTGDGTGTVAFPLSYAGGTLSGQVTVAETQQPGYQIVPVNGRNAVCTNLVTQQPVTGITDVTNGVRVAVPQNETVNCTVYNRAPDRAATVQVDKVWRVLDESGTETGRYRIPGDEGPLPQGLSAQLTLTGPGGAGATPNPWGEPRSGYAAGNAVTIAETTGIDAAKLPGCTLTSQQLTKRGSVAVTETVPASATLTPGANTFELTNTVTCASTLTLLKTVSGGSASPANWDLTAAPQGGGQPKTVSGAPTRSAGNTFGVAPAAQYALSEALHDPSTPLAYLLDRVERCAPDASAPGGCIWTPVDESAPVSVGIGQHEVYRFVNVAAPALEVPLTGGVSSDALNIAGAGLAALALLVGSLSWAHRRRRSASA
ncbi:vWA domain-containing protein [Leucobacter chromiireducens]|uniref:vWA domain-containing protein n=1 Tax=Leucobacter chromiireducens TaxID=283877 RepID=UPI000F6341BC|nr:vWA domain-containing protein [Leucobacter chromiireducens]